MSFLTGNFAVNLIIMSVVIILPVTSNEANAVPGVSAPPPPPSLNMPSPPQFSSPSPEEIVKSHETPPPPSATCPPSNIHPKSCQPNEVYMSCDSMCQPSCTRPHVPKNCPRICIPRCLCRSGFVRREDDNACIPRSQCLKNNIDEKSLNNIPGQPRLVQGINCVPGQQYILPGNNFVPRQQYVFPGNIYVPGQQHATNSFHRQQHDMNNFPRQLHDMNTFPGHQHDMNSFPGQQHYIGKYTRKYTKPMRRWKEPNRYFNVRNDDIGCAQGYPCPRIPRKYTKPMRRWKVPNRHFDMPVKMCPANERFTMCAGSCEPTCEKPKLICTRGYTCIPPLVRSDDGKCVRRSQCSSKN